MTGTSEVDPKLVFPVEGLAAYLREKHGLEADGQYLVYLVMRAYCTMFKANKKSSGMPINFMCLY